VAVWAYALSATDAPGQTVQLRWSTDHVALTWTPAGWRVLRLATTEGPAGVSIVENASAVGRGLPEQLTWTPAGIGQ
jgi:hypothetical protein